MIDTRLITTPDFQIKVSKFYSDEIKLEMLSTRGNQKAKTVILLDTNLAILNVYDVVENAEIHERYKIYLRFDDARKLAQVMLSLKSVNDLELLKKEIEEIARRERERAEKLFNELIEEKIKMLLEIQAVEEKVKKLDKITNWDIKVLAREFIEKHLDI